MKAVNFKKVVTLIVYAHYMPYSNSTVSFSTMRLDHFVQFNKAPTKYHTCFLFEKMELFLMMEGGRVLISSAE
jgi:hypothetical protein